jgi:hypothetical protein
MTSKRSGKKDEDATATVTKLYTSRSQQNRTTLQHEQRSPGEWRQLRTPSVAKLATLYWWLEPRGKGVKSFSGLEACSLVKDTLVACFRAVYTMLKILGHVSWTHYGILWILQRNLTQYHVIHHHHHQWRYSPDRALASLTCFMIIIVLCGLSAPRSMWFYTPWFSHQRHLVVTTRDSRYHVIRTVHLHEHYSLWGLCL